MALGSGRLWTEEEDRIILSRRKDRQQWAVIGKALGRTAKACSVRYAALTRPVQIGNPAATDAIKAASQRLGREMLYHQQRYAKAHCIPLVEAQLRLMGGSFHVSLCAPLKTASAARLAA